MVVARQALADRSVNPGFVEDRSWHGGTGARSRQPGYRLIP
jgi:hypothetical protein